MSFDLHLFDSHCHLDHPSLRHRLPEVIAAAGNAGVKEFLIPGVEPSAWGDISDISAGFPPIHPAFGVHPMHAALVTPEVESKLRQLSRSARAIGEIGLDYALPTVDRKLQQAALQSQLAIAAEAGLPVLIHCRNAFADLLAILKEHRVERFGGVMHAFSGSPEIARECIRLGLHISLAGSVTWANAVRPPAVAASVPLERLLLETDAPDLSPEPYRGCGNVPAYLLETARRIAGIRAISLEELAQATTANAHRLFKIS